MSVHRSTEDTAEETLMLVQLMAVFECNHVPALDGILVFDERRER
jgi:hypothetical protein